MNHNLFTGPPHPGMYWLLVLLRRVMGFIFPVILVYLVYNFFIQRKKEVHIKLETPIERLKMRLAKGEITKEEYEDLKNIIEE